MDSCCSFSRNGSWTKNGINEEKKSQRSLEEGDEVEVLWRNQLDHELSWYPGKISSINWDEYFVVDFCVKGRIETDVFEKKYIRLISREIFQEVLHVRPELWKAVLGPKNLNISRVRAINGVTKISINPEKFQLLISAKTESVAKMAKKLLDINEKVYIVPKYLISRIIGQKGKQIQEIIDNSKISKVRFPNDEESSGILQARGISSVWEKSVIVFIGCPSSLERAELLMDYLVASLEETDEFCETPGKTDEKETKKKDNSKLKLATIQEKNQLVTSGYSTDSSINSTTKRRRGCRGGRKNRRKSSSISDFSGLSESDAGVYSELSFSDMELSENPEARKSLESLAEIQSRTSSPLNQTDDYELLSPDEPECATPESGSISLEGSDLTALSEFDSLEGLDMDWADDDVQGGTPIFSEGDEIFEYSSQKHVAEPINYRQALVKNLSIDERIKNLECEIKEEKKKRMRGTRGGKKMRKRNLKKKNENFV